jgi:CRISPR-associated endoribonuclease Cas6
MLTSLVVTLRPLAAGSRPANLGRAAHALLLRWVEAVDPALARALHEGEPPRPFTCSNLAGGRRRAGSLELDPGRDYWLRVTALTAGLSAALRRALLERPPGTADLDGALFRVLAATADPAAHPWAGAVTYQELAAARLLGGPPPPARLGLRFASPTAFRSAGMTVPLPLPDLVFGSLLDRWQAFAPVAVNPEVRRFAAEQVAVARYQLRTRALPFKPGAMQVGFAGDCHYVALSHDRYWLSVLHLLADYAFYAGVGYQTAVGMGQARSLPGRE